MSEWKEYRLGELYAVPTKNGLTRPSRDRGEGIKMLNMGELFAFNRINNPSMELVKVTPEEFSKFSLEEFDLIFARQSLVAEGAGKCSIILKVPEPTVFESHLIRVRLDLKKVNPFFIYYFFSSKLGHGLTQGIVMEVAASGIRGSDLANLKFRLPPLPTQQKIAHILGTYDELIEVNNERIKILEETAQSLYKEWFVRFRFPNYQETEFIKGVPKGWEVVSLELLAGVNTQNIKAKDTDEIFYVDISSVSTGKINSKTQYIFKDAPGRAKRLVKDGDVLFATVRPENRAYAIIVNAEKNLIASTGFAVISHKPPTSKSYIYLTISSDAFIEEMVNKSKGAAYPQVGFDDIKNYQLLNPSKDVMSLFDKITNPMFTQIETLQQQNTELRQIRDRLLPRLISGKMEV